MLGNDTMKTASIEIMSIRRRNDIEKSTWRTHQYFVDFEYGIHVEISTSNRCHNFHVDSPFRIDVILTNFSRGTSMSNRWWIDQDMFIGKVLIFRSSCAEVLSKKSVVSNFAKFTAKHLCHSLMLDPGTLKAPLS